MSKSLRVISLALLFPLFSFSQNEMPSETIELNVGLTKHGTGDLGGFIINAEYRKYIRPRIYFTGGLATTINDGFRELTYSSPSGETVDGSIRNVIGGIQLSSRLGWDFVRRAQSSFSVSLGPLVRYQTSTVPDALSIYFPEAGTGFPFPAVVFEQYSPQRTFSLGGVLQLSYRYQLPSKFFVGANAAFQTDTNGDALPQVGVAFGTRI